jgi:hypothetical protein
MSGSGKQKRQKKRKQECVTKEEGGEEEEDFPFSEVLAGLDSTDLEEPTNEDVETQSELEEQRESEAQNLSKIGTLWSCNVQKIQDFFDNDPASKSKVKEGHLEKKSTTDTKNSRFLT